MIAIIDYQAGNQTSVQRAFRHLGLESVISDRPETLKAAQGIVFPGVGAAGQAMNLLKERGLSGLVRDLAESKPFLGICLGCQIMLEDSEEDGGIQTLGLIPGHNRRFSPELSEEDGQRIRIPHMGWNSLKKIQDSPLLAGLEPDDQFYFVHSYYPEAARQYVIAQTCYGRDFTSIFGRDGLWAVQFHPEKSGRPGLRLLRNFYDYAVSR